MKSDVAEIADMLQGIAEDEERLAKLRDMRRDMDRDINSLDVSILNRRTALVKKLNEAGIALNEGEKWEEAHV